MEALTTDKIILGMTWWIVLVFSTCLHEAGHAWAALKLGDPTAYEGGQVTLNPMPHIQRSPFGMVVVPLICFVMSGWMIGWASAPYDPRWAANYPRRAGLMALAGPAGNLILVIVSGVLLRVGLSMGAFEIQGNIFQLFAGTEPGVSHSIATILSIFFVLNLILMTFNLMPVPPLDGSAAIPLLLPLRWHHVYLDYVRTPGLWFVGIMVAWHLFPKVFFYGVLPVAMKCFSIGM